MNCNEAAEFVSARFDGETIPREAAEHLEGCAECAARLKSYAAIGAELRRVASAEEPGLLRDAARWKETSREKAGLWRKGVESMRIPRFAFVAMIAVIVALSLGLALVRVRANNAGPVLALSMKIPSGAHEFHCKLDTTEQVDRPNCGNFGIVKGGMLSVSAQFTERQGDNVEIEFRTRYENPPPHYNGPSQDRLNDVVGERVWITPGDKKEVNIVGLGKMEVSGIFLDHMPPTFFEPDSKVDPGENEFRIVSPVLLRGKELVFNLAGASTGSAEDEDPKDQGTSIYWPGEGRFLISPQPFKGATQGNVFESQATFKMDGAEYLLLTAVPPTRGAHLWMKHDPSYRPSQENPGQDDSKSALGGGGKNEFPRE
jgi:hypothetical protein